MQVKDRLYSWLIQNIIIPKMEILDKPGFIVSQFTEKNEHVYLRELFFPEKVLADIETGVVAKYGDIGRQALYSAGKKFGYRYAMSSKFPQKEKCSEKEFLKFCYNLVRFTESMYAKSLQHKIDLEHGVFTLTMKDYMTCRLNGLGYFLAEGSIAGVWSYMWGDNSVEGIQLACQGKGAKECKMVCAPKSYLSKFYPTFSIMTEVHLKNLDLAPEYTVLNQIKPSKFSRNSCKTLLENGVLKYQEGIVSFKGDRYVLNEASSMYLLENELNTLKGATDIIFDSAYAYFKAVGQREKSQEFITDFLPALGWGDTAVTTKNGKVMAYTLSFPWTKFSRGITFAMYRGMLSGLLSGIHGKKIILDKLAQDTKTGVFNLSLEAS